MDQKKVGIGVKSACGTPLYMAEKLKLKETVLQVHKKIILHTPRGTLDYILAKPFCVIDPEKFTQALFKMGKAEKLRARVESFDGKGLKTNKGNFKAKIFVDASGPGSSLLQNEKTAQSRDLSFGIETILPYKEEGLHFWYQPKKYPACVFWLFPQGKTSRFGVASYKGETKLRPYLEEFMNRFSLKIGSLHGGYFPHRLREPVIDKVFLVGDSAGQCLPITGEGIRPAIIFGQKLGEVIEKILSGKTTLETGLSQYKDFVLKRKFYYEIVYFGQRFLTNIPESLFFPLAFLVSKKPVTYFVLNNYLRIIENG